MNADDWVGKMIEVSADKHYEPCAKCGKVFDVNTDEVEQTSKGLMCWTCIEESHLDDIKES